MGKRKKKPVQRHKVAQAPLPPEERFVRPQDRPQRPTAQRMARGTWAMPQGAKKSEQPMVDMTEDMIGYLHTKQIISDAQLNAARAWQELRAAYVAEWPETSGYKSCLNGEQPGYDDSDGNPEVVKRYDDIKRSIGREYFNEVVRVCLDSLPPRHIHILRCALDAVNKC